MSAARRDTAAARAALARRRQRGIFTPSPTNVESLTSPAEGRAASLPTKPATQSHSLTTPASSVQTTTKDIATAVPPSGGSTATANRSRAASAPVYPVQRATPSESPRTKSVDSKAADVHNGHHSPVRNRKNDRLPTSTVRFQASDAEQDDESQENEDEHKATEEPEPAIVGGEILDAKCLLYSTSITIRSQANVRDSISASKQIRGDSARYLATVSGAGLERENIVFHLVRTEGLEEDEQDNVVRYGDTVALRSEFAQSRTLGVRTHWTNEMSGATYDLGFFRSTVGPAEKWTVLRGGRAVLVGSAAKQNHATRKGKTAAVRSGDPLLLRNHFTGGLLSIDGDELTLVTDSYDSHLRRTGYGTDTDPLSSIQHHDQIVPSAMEMFQFVHSNVPPCPQWTDETSQRMYEDGLYLVQAGRNDRDEDTKLKVFGAAAGDGRKSTRAPLKTSNINMQEKLLIDEVIGSFFGLEGQYVQYGPQDGEDPEFYISEPEGMSLNASLRNLVNLLLPLSTAFVHVRSFVSLHRPGYEYGFVVQAVCESLDSLLEEHFEFAATMEQLLRQGTGSDILTMNKLHVHAQTPLRRMTVLEQVTLAIQDKKGGSLLNCLHELKSRDFAGDGIAQNVIKSLLEHASVPYFKMLEAWLESGMIHDPFDEFMIGVGEQLMDESLTARTVFGGYDGDTWNELFQIRSEHVLENLLSSPIVRQQVLLTGKYWNAVQLCQQYSTNEIGVGRFSERKFSSQLSYGMDAVSISTLVHRMYRSASQELLGLVTREFDIMETLRTMKRYFLLDQGDFLVHFLDAAENELLKELSDVSRGRVQHWLGMCVQLTEPNSDDAPSSAALASARMPAGPLTAQMLKCSFAPESLQDHLDALHAEKGGICAHSPKTPSRHPYGMMNKGITGVEAFTIHFSQIPFPTSLILSQRALCNYQLLFRHLFFAKHVERRLVDIWLDHQMMKQFQSLRRAMGPTYCLRQRMLHFMQNFIYYIMFEVIEPNWLTMENAIRKQQSEGTQTVDDIVKLHNQFLELALTECLLTHRDLIRTLTKLMSTCLLFSDQLKRFMEATKIVSTTLRMQVARIEMAIAN